MRSFIVAMVAIVAAFGVGLAMPRAGSKVTYIPADQVKAAFAKGAVLLNNGSYQVHASRREEPGQVEVHVKDTDVIYMLEGSTTFVTGGTMVGGKTTAPTGLSRRLCPKSSLPAFPDLERGPARHVR